MHCGDGARRERKKKKKRFPVEFGKNVNPKVINTVKNELTTCISHPSGTKRRWASVQQVSNQHPLAHLSAPPSPQTLPPWLKPVAVQRLDVGLNVLSRCASGRWLSASHTLLVAAKQDPSSFSCLSLCRCTGFQDPWVIIGPFHQPGLGLGGWRVPTLLE